MSGAQALAYAWALFNKIKGLRVLYYALDYVRIISRLFPIIIFHYLPLPLLDYLDNVDAFFRPKKGGSPHFRKTPPSKI
jgi:hypothetical protein